jgi:hypothetical protein
MRFPKRVVACGMLALTTVTAACGDGARQSALPSAPRAGTLLEQAPLPPEVGLDAAASVTRLLYATSDRDDKPETSSGAVFLPEGEAPPGGWPVIAWAHGTVGLGDSCAPSARPRSERDSAYLDRWLRSGYAIVASDYSGIGTPGIMSYVNRDKANAVVDSVRAAHRMGFPLAARWAAVGQSQGSSAALVAGHEAAARAPELDFRGTVATGVPAGVPESVLRLAPGSDIKGYSPSATAYFAYYLAAIDDRRPDIDIRSALTSNGIEALELAQNLCLGELTERLRHEDPTAFISKPLAEVPGLRDYLDIMFELPADRYPAPVFIGQGAGDKDARVGYVDKLVQAMRDAGSDVRYQRYSTAGHSEVVLESASDSSAFLARVLGG